MKTILRQSFTLQAYIIQNPALKNLAYVQIRMG